LFHVREDGINVKVIFTCGGTAGHVNPALALAGLMKKREPDTEVLFVGTPGGIERKLANEAGYPFMGIEVTGFERSFSPAGIRHNIGAVNHLLAANHKAAAIVREFGPDLVVGTGGYASYPVVRCASKMGIPSAVHESNTVPGLTTKMLEGYADCIMVGFEDCRAFYKHPDKIRVTGTPVRGDFFEHTKMEAKRALGVDDGRPLLVSFWGSLGATHMNEKMGEFFACEAKEASFHHIHAMGQSGWLRLGEWCAPYNVDVTRVPTLDVREYIYNMALVMRAADLVLCRAGASTLSELTALSMPAILVPSPYVTNNHQEKNARLLEKHGGAKVILEKECTGATLFEEARAILYDAGQLAKMSRGMGELGIPDATQKIYDTVLALRR
jgi:UDP-N-acetylglucosamine--N-acetylmuramyl-(pentapeptide) pyrophosphoryl-undecaprenol N-acetylglucosamine transferase